MFAICDQTVTQATAAKAVAVGPPIKISGGLILGKKSTAAPLVARVATGPSPAAKAPSGIAAALSKPASSKGLASTKSVASKAKPRAHDDEFEDYNDDDNYFDEDEQFGGLSVFPSPTFFQNCFLLVIATPAGYQDSFVPKSKPKSAKPPVASTKAQPAAAGTPSPFLPYFFSSCVYIFLFEQSLQLVLHFRLLHLSRFHCRTHHLVLFYRCWVKQ
jgi:hypothetical protein